MDLKTWLRRHEADGSPVGRLISHAAWSRDPELLFIDISKGVDPDFDRSFKALAQGLLEAFKREGGKFKHPDSFRRLKPGKFIGGDVIQFRPRAVQSETTSFDQSWTAFYAAVVGIEIEGDVIEISGKRDQDLATVTPLVPIRNRKRSLLV